jgi:hypothetical protein
MFGVDGTTPFSGPSASLREQCGKIRGNLWLAGPNILADNSRVFLPPLQLKERLAQLRDVFEYMLIDAPGTSVCGDAQLLSQVADAAILVIEANSKRRLTARKAKQTLEAAGASLLGTGLHNRSFPIPERLYKRLWFSLSNRRSRADKFRSMVVHGEARHTEIKSRGEVSGPVLKIKIGPRIARTDKVLRKTGIDGLLQLFNTLKGRMSMEMAPIAASCALVGSAFVIPSSMWGTLIVSNRSRHETTRTIAVPAQSSEA